MSGWMTRRVISSGLLGGILALLWTAVIQGGLPQRDAWGYKEVPEEAKVLAVLDQELPETGLYLIPGHAPPDSLFRARYEDGPLYRVHSLRSGAGGLPSTLGNGALSAQLLASSHAERGVDVDCIGRFPRVADHSGDYLPRLTSLMISSNR
jgi:hypothetical protein